VAFDLGQSLTEASESELSGAAPDREIGAAPRRRLPLSGIFRTLVVVGFVVATWQQSPDFVGVLGLAAIWAVATVGLGLVLGVAGQISLCQASFVLVGAYMDGTIAKQWHGPTILGLLASGGAGAAAALIVSPVLRARGYYLAIATMAVALLTTAVITTGSWIPGGNAGLIGVPPLELFGYRFVSENAYLVLAAVVLVMSIAALHLRYGRGHVRRAIQALHHDEDLLAGYGGNPARLKREVFVVGGLLAGLAGGLYAGDFGYVSVNGFGLVESFALALAVFIGGSNRLAGAAFGALVYQASFTVLGSNLVDYRFVLLGAIVVVTVHFFPRGLMPSLGDFEGWLPSWRRFRDAREPAPEGKSKPPPPVRPLTLEVEGVTKSFGALRAVDGISLSVRPQSLTALIGPNGAGKTTLLDLVAGDQRVSGGTILVDGADMTDRGRVTLSRLGLARTYQRIRLIPSLTVLENVLLGVDHAARGTRTSEGERRRRAAAALGEVGLAGRGRAFVGSLTFGQRRLVEMARAVASRPRLVLLDEPSSGLNDAETEGFADVIRRLHETGSTIVLVEHNLPFVRALAEDVVALDRGKLLAHGNTEHVFGLPEFQRSYVGGALEPA
jgi:branched-chain amino acid transport system permease protein